MRDFYYRCAIVFENEEDWEKGIKAVKIEGSDGNEYSLYDIAEVFNNHEYERMLQPIGMVFEDAYSNRKYKTYKIYDRHRSTDYYDALTAYIHDTLKEEIGGKFTLAADYSDIDTDRFGDQIMYYFGGDQGVRSAFLGGVDGFKLHFKEDEGKLFSWIEKNVSQLTPEEVKAAAEGGKAIEKMLDKMNLQSQTETIDLRSLLGIDDEDGEDEADRDFGGYFDEDDNEDDNEDNNEDDDEDGDEDGEDEEFDFDFLHIDADEDKDGGDEDEDAENKPEQGEKSEKGTAFRFEEPKSAAVSGMDALSQIFGMILGPNFDDIHQEVKQMTEEERIECAKDLSELILRRIILATEDPDRVVRNFLAINNGTIAIACHELFPIPDKKKEEIRKYYLVGTTEDSNVSNIATMAKMYHDRCLTDESGEFAYTSTEEDHLDTLEGYLNGVFCTNDTIAQYMKILFCYIYAGGEPNLTALSIARKAFDKSQNGDDEDAEADDCNADDGIEDTEDTEDTEDKDETADENDFDEDGEDDEMKMPQETYWGREYFIEVQTGSYQDTEDLIAALLGLREKGYKAGEEPEGINVEISADGVGTVLFDHRHYSFMDLPNLYDSEENEEIYALIREVVAAFAPKPFRVHFNFIDEWAGYRHRGECRFDGEKIEYSDVSLIDGMEPLRHVLKAEYQNGKFVKEESWDESYLLKFDTVLDEVKAMSTEGRVKCAKDLTGLAGLRMSSISDPENLLGNVVNFFNGTLACACRGLSPIPEKKKDEIKSYFASESEDAPENIFSMINSIYYDNYLTGEESGFAIKCSDEKLQETLRSYFEMLNECAHREKYLKILLCCICAGDEPNPVGLELARAAFEN